MKMVACKALLLLVCCVTVLQLTNARYHGYYGSPEDNSLEYDRSMGYYGSPEENSLEYGNPLERQPSCACCQQRDQYGRYKRSNIQRTSPSNLPVSRHVIGGDSRPTPQQLQAHLCQRMSHQQYGHSFLWHNPRVIRMAEVEDKFGDMEWSYTIVGYSYRVIWNDATWKYDIDNEWYRKGTLVGSNYHLKGTIFDVYDPSKITQQTIDVTRYDNA